MGCLSDEDKEKIRSIIHKGAEAEADVIIDFTENLYASMPEGESAAKEWAERQAKAFSDARMDMTRKFTETVKGKMSADN